MSATIKLKYGSMQLHLSSKMQRNPLVSKWIHRVFGYTNIGNYARSRVFIRQLRQVPVEDMQQILDLGCGYGEYAFMMAKGFPKARITALDIDPDALRNVRNGLFHSGLKNIDIHEGMLDTCPVNQFDFIYSVDVFEHIPADQMPFREASAHLKTGGYLMVKMPHVTQSSIFPKRWFEDHNQWLDHEHPGQVYSLEDLKNRFRTEGFEVVFAQRTDGLLSRLAWELAYLAKRMGVIGQLISLPFCKLLVNFENLKATGQSSNGNAITVIGKKL